MSKVGQMETVRKVVEGLQPIRTEQVKIQAMYHGVSCADRYLRWLQEKKIIYSYKARPEDKTLTWCMVGFQRPLL